MPSIHLLGTAQDAGLPHAGCSCAECRRAWNNPSHRRLPVALGLQQEDSWFLIDATPSLPEQLYRMWLRAPGAKLAGVVLTHLHMGHYGGLLQFGRESMSTRGLPLYATPRALAFLQENEPWRALFVNGNLTAHPIEADQPVELSPSLAITPVAVPHRAEYSDTMAFIITIHAHRLLYLPDIDRWDRWDRDIRDVVETVDVALLDATFFSSDELPGRDLAEIPHPFVVDTIELLRGTTRDVRLIHLNHSNPLNHDGPERTLVKNAGLRVASEGDSWLVDR